MIVDGLGFLYARFGKELFMRDIFYTFCRICRKQAECRPVAAQDGRGKLVVLMVCRACRATFVGGATC